MAETKTAQPATVSCNVTRKFNTGNYQSVDVGFGLQIAANSGESPAKALERVTDLVFNQANEKWKEMEDSIKGGGK